MSLTVGAAVLICGGYIFFLYNTGKSLLFKNDSQPSTYKTTPKTKQIPTNYQKDTYTLSGIIYEKDQPLAVINGKTVSEGEKIGSGEIIKINKDSVEIKTENKTKLLNLE